MRVKKRWLKMSFYQQSGKILVEISPAQTSRSLWTDAKKNNRNLPKQNQKQLHNLRLHKQSHPVSYTSFVTQTESTNQLLKLPLYKSSPLPSYTISLSTQIESPISYTSSFSKQKSPSTCHKVLFQRQSLQRS